MEYLFQRLYEDLGAYIASPRRDFTYWAILAVSTVATVASDFLGVMRWLLSFNPEAAREAGLDQIYEVQGLKSYKREGRYTLRFPGTYLFDQSVAFSQQAARENVTMKSKRSVIPDAAFGPAGGGLVSQAKAENLSVVVQPVPFIDRLEEFLGEPREAFEKLVRNRIAPEGSGKSVELLTATQRPGQRSPGTMYEFEYVLTKPVKEGGQAVLHTWSSVALGPAGPRRDSRPLYTMAIVAPEQSLSPERRRVFEDSWRSFELEP